MALTLEEANRMVQAGIAKAVELNVNMSIAVCDAGGSLLAFNRMPGASAVSAAVAQGKAAAAAGFGRPSGSLQAGFSGNSVNHQFFGWADASGPGRSAHPQGRRVGRLYWRKRRHGRAGRRLRQGRGWRPSSLHCPNRTFRISPIPEIAATQAIREPVY